MYSRCIDKCLKSTLIHIRLFVWKVYNYVFEILLMLRNWIHTTLNTPQLYLILLQFTFELK